MSIKLKEIFPPIIIMLLGGLIIFITPIQVSKAGSTSFVNPRFLPYILGGAIIFLSLISIVTELLKRSIAFDETLVTHESEKEEELGEQKSYGRVLIALMSIISWTVLLPYIGFIISTLLLIIIMMKLMGNKKKNQLILTPLIFTICIYIVMKVIMKLPIPSGVF